MPTTGRTSRKSASSSRSDPLTLHHLSIPVSSLQRSAGFYDAVLGALGYVRAWSAAHEVGYGVDATGDQFAIKSRDAPLAVPGAGFHIAFAARTREAVAAFHQQALQHGGRDDGAPGLRTQYAPDYYAAFAIDPDGYRIEAVHRATRGVSDGWSDNR